MNKINVVEELSGMKIVKRKTLNTLKIDWRTV